MATKVPVAEKSTDRTNNQDDYVARVALRAEWEAFDFSIGAPGHLKVQNLSYGDSEARNHTYIVRCEAGKTVECTCKADEYRSGPCKHRVACEAREALMLAASADADTVRSARGMD